MWGAATHDRSTGVHRPLTATTFWLQKLQSGTDLPHVVIGLDHCLLWPTEMDRLLESISLRAAVPRESIVVFFSHTHGAGLMGLERSHLPGGELIEFYLEELAERLSQSVVKARDRKTPATIVYGTGHCDLATNRDFYDDARGHYVCGFNHTGVSDDTVVVGRITNDTGHIIATLVNYACHPTTLAWKNTLISPDYPGAMREVIETATGAPCLFIQGASGDIGPREGFVGDPAVADRNGRQLGYAALSTLEGLPHVGQQYTYVGPVVSGATLGVWDYQPQAAKRTQQVEQWADDLGAVALRYRADLPTKAELLADRSRWQAEEQSAATANDAVRSEHAHAMVERATRGLTRTGSLPEGDSYPYPLIVWRMGDAIWVVLDGEHYNLLQRVLRERFPQVTLVIGTIANGSKVWYLPDAASFGLGLYQEEVSILERGCLEKVINAATAAIQRLLG